MQISIGTLLLYALGVTLVAFAGGIPPLFRAWSSRQLHLFIAFGGGTILGAIFLHLLPDALAMGSSDLASAMILLGFSIILLVERILIKTHGHGQESLSSLGRHQLVGITALVGLSAHTLSGGFALAVGFFDPQIGLVIFMAIIAHKATEAFSLSTMFRLAEFSRRKSIALLLLYSLMTPIGALISLPFINRLQNLNLSIPTGLTAGTFLYVATLDLIPEAFHGDKGRVMPFIWLVIGMLIMYLIKFLGV